MGTAAVPALLPSAGMRPVAQDRDAHAQVCGGGPRVRGRRRARRGRRAGRSPGRAGAALALRACMCRGVALLAVLAGRVGRRAWGAAGCWHACALAPRSLAGGHVMSRQRGALQTGYSLLLTKMALWWRS